MGGTITPSGIIIVTTVGTQQFTITPDPGHHLIALLVDSVAVDSITSYTFTNVNANHTITAIFGIDTFSIAVSAPGGNGSVNPSGTVVATYGETLEDAGYKTIISTSPEEALAKLRNIIPDLILYDVRFPDSPLNGLAIYEEVRKMPHFNTVPFLFLSAVTDDHIMHAGLGSGADDYITKPFNPDTLLAIIEGKLKRYKQLRQTRGV